MIALGIALGLGTHHIHKACNAEIILATPFVLSLFRYFAVNNDSILVGDQIAIFPRFRDWLRYLYTLTKR